LVVTFEIADTMGSTAESFWTIGWYNRNTVCRYYAPLRDVSSCTWRNLCWRQKTLAPA